MGFEGLGLAPAPMPAPTPAPTPAPMPTPPPCDPKSPDVSAPLGFEAMDEQGWWANYTRAWLGGSGTVKECAALCEAYGAQCSGFHVWKPCAIGDCYVFLGGLESFSVHEGAFAFKRSSF